MKVKLYQELANKIWVCQHFQRQLDNAHNQAEIVSISNTIDTIENDINELKLYLPHGSGFDAGTELDLDKQRVDKLIFISSYHLMDEMGGYDGWIDFTVTVTPSFSSYNLDVKGRFSKLRNCHYGLKAYIEDTFRMCLEQELHVGNTLA